MAGKEGFIVEFRPVGNVVKVSAIDPESGTEVSIVGAKGLAQKDMEAVAVRKLRYVLAKKAEQD